MTRRKRFEGTELALPASAPSPPPPLPPVAPAATTDPPAPVQLRTLEQAAEALAVSERTLRRLIGRGTIHSVKIGGQIRISEAELRRVATEGVD